MTELPFTVENCQIGKLVKHYDPYISISKQNKKEIDITNDLGLIIAINKKKNTVLIRWFGFSPHNFNKNTISHHYIKDIYDINYITIIQQ